MSTIPFSRVPLGASFRFSAETVLGWPGARGPWIKLTPRKYMLEDGGPECKVGTVHLNCVLVAPKEARS